MRQQYPRTPHLPWSPGVGRDDVRAFDLSGLAGREVVVTEKLDGENTTLYADGLHARSLDSGHHPSRAWVKALQARIGHAIPEGYRVCGENMYARHSIPYDGLESYFYGFCVWDELGWCPGWDWTVAFLRGLGVPTPRVLWRGVFDERALRRLRVDTQRQEGYVVRTADGFMAHEFGRRVAKWVRPGHVQTGTHWMHSAVTPNGLSPRAALWDVRSGAEPDTAVLLEALGRGADGGDRDAAHEVAARVGGLGDRRLAGVLAALLHREPRSVLAGRLATALGLPLARRVADLVGLYGGLQRPYPDEERRTGLVRLSYAADLGVLHALAAALAPDAAAREQVEWSALHAAELEDAETLDRAFRKAFGDLGADAAARCLGEARELYALGRIGTPEEAVAATWRLRDGAFPRLVHLVGPSGSGKSTFARGLPGVDAHVSLDALREERGDRADQRDGGAVLRSGLERLDAALARGGTVVWDATSLNPHQRHHVHAVARRRDALVTHAVALVDDAELARRNAVREHPVPPGVLEAQLRRFVPPYPGQAHRTWYIGAGGTVEEEA
ncbi:RNA ligase family protein [Streptomyces sp. enrichment culture]|uniref:RNA ligase family protein n=1 Tax=Streptomyces sp. enrichment culture TaxID=1795815 RepID=UPI003F55F6E8